MITPQHFEAFQAFVNREDAEKAITLVWVGYVVRKVYLYQAAQGIIKRMDRESNDKPGWTAKKIRVPKLRK